MSDVFVVQRHADHDGFDIAGIWEDEERAVRHARRVVQEDMPHQFWTDWVEIHRLPVGQPMPPYTCDAESLVWHSERDAEPAVS